MSRKPVNPTKEWRVCVCYAIVCLVIAILGVQSKDSVTFWVAGGVATFLSVAAWLWAKGLRP